MLAGLRAVPLEVAMELLYEEREAANAGGVEDRYLRWVTLTFVVDDVYMQIFHFTNKVYLTTIVAGATYISFPKAWRFHRW